jgi:hypothetical protein
MILSVCRAALGGSVPLLATETSGDPLVLQSRTLDRFLDDLVNEDSPHATIPPATTRATPAVDQRPPIVVIPLPAALLPSLASLGALALSLRSRRWTRWIR